MTYLIDTDWVVDFLNGRPPATQLLTSLAPEGIAISLMTLGEIYDGIIHGRRPDAAEAGFEAFLRWVDVIAFDVPIMRLFGRLRGDLRAAGRPIGDIDLLIAATAMHHGLTLVTRNLRHFERIPDLRLFTSSALP